MNEEQFDDKVVGKLDRVAKYMDSIKGKTFGEEHQGGKNMMAKAVLFSLYFKEMVDYIGSITKDGATPKREEDVRVIHLCDNLIDIYGASEATMELFWSGKQPIKPSEIPFSIHGGGKTFVNLEEVKEIKI